MDAISFVKIKNDKCYDPDTAKIIGAADPRIADVCSCCNRSLTEDNTVVCSGGSDCPSCCTTTSGSTGCNTGLGCGLSDVVISSKSCKPPSSIDECPP